MFGAKEALNGFVVASGDAACILELVEAPLDEVAQGMQWIDTDANLA